MQAGPKRHRLEIQQDHPTRGPDGGPISNWTTLATVWAEGGPLSGRELWQARQAQSDVTHVFKVRWGAVIADLSGSVRAVLDGKKYLHLKNARNTQDRDLEWVLEFSEAPDQSAV